MAPGLMSPQPISSGREGNITHHLPEAPVPSRQHAGMPASKPGSSRAAPASGRIIPGSPSLLPAPLALIQPPAAYPG